MRAFRDNIAKLVGEGYPQDQAVAAAIRTLEDSCKKRGKPMPDIGEIVAGDYYSPEAVEAISAHLDKTAADSPPCRPTTIWGAFDYNKD